MAYRKYNIKVICCQQDFKDELDLRFGGHPLKGLSLQKDGGQVKNKERFFFNGEVFFLLPARLCERVKYQYSGDTQRKLAVKLIKEVSEKEGINLKEMQSGSRR